MYKRLNKLVAPALLALCFILLTAIVAQSDNSMSTFGRFCFMFHSVPYEIGFSGADTYFVWIYYPFLWVVLTVLFSWTGHLARLNYNQHFKNPKN
jgi:uncharacterized membrane protein